jgi:hypothetical protein
MLYVVTVHHASPRWIEIQTRHIRRHIGVPHEIWTSLEKIDPSYGTHFDTVLELQAPHAPKLNAITTEICEVAEDGDLMMFLDGDSFPIADPMPLVQESLAKAPLVAVRRAENGDEPQPHPCFTVTSVGTWKTLRGDWTAGYTWPGVHGRPNSDVGGNLLRKLELAGMPWVQVLRSNKRNPDPLYLAIYGDIVYHHGAGLTGGLSPAHRALAPKAAPLPGNPVGDVAVRWKNRRRWNRWERDAERSIARKSQQYFERIRDDPEDRWLAELM